MKHDVGALENMRIAVHEHAEAESIRFAHASVARRGSLSFAFNAGALADQSAIETITRLALVVKERS